MLSLLLTMVTASSGTCDVTLTVNNAGASARVGAPASMRTDLSRLFDGQPQPGRLRLAEIGVTKQSSVPVQFESDQPGGTQGTLWWLMPAGEATQRRFRLSLADADAPTVLSISNEEDERFYDVAEGGAPVLRYNHSTTAVPEGVDPKYARGDYIQPLFGLHGEALTDDYPKDHPHHRGIGWSWPVTRWKDEVRDIWAVVGVWSRPVTMRRVAGGSVMAVLEAENVWKWGDEDEIVREEVVIRAFRATDFGRFVDIEVRLTALQDRVAIGGRPHGAYGGFGLRAAPVEEQKITAYTDEEGADPRRSWLDYSGKFTGGDGVSGLTIFEHPTNPGYPNKLLTYPSLNYVMPAFPGDREVPLSKDEPVVLKHRLWIHAGAADEAGLAAVWQSYANAPTATVTKQ